MKHTAEQNLFITQRAERIAALLPQIMHTMLLSRTHPTRRMGPELTFHQYQSLLIINDLKECTLRELSTRLHTAPSTTSQLVDRLVRSELITRTSHTGDRRKILLTLTEEGHEVMRKRTSDVRRNYAHLLATLSENEQAEFEDAFVTIYRVASKVEARMKELQATQAEADEV